MFWKKKPPTDEELNIASVWSGIIYRQYCTANGHPPPSEAHSLIVGIVERVVKQMNISPSQDYLPAMRATASTIGNDTSGLGERLEKQFDGGNRSLTESDIQLALNLSHEMVLKFADISKAGKP